MNRKEPPPTRFRRRFFRCSLVWRVLFLAVLGVWSGRPLSAQAVQPAGVAGSERVITDLGDLWSMTTEERSKVYPLRIEGRVNFFDPAWNNLWFGHGEVGRYVQLVPGNAPALRNGQWVRIEGVIVPAQGLAADRVRVLVLQDQAPVNPIETAGRISEVRAFDRQVVTARGYVDEQQLTDAQHLRLSMIVDDRQVICWVPPDPHGVLPDWQGRFVKVVALYSGRVDPTATDAMVELWVAQQADVEVVGSIGNDPQFAIPQTPISQISALPLGTMVRVRGQVLRREMGSHLTVRGGDGEILVHSLQHERVPPGAEIEVVGRTAMQGSRWVLESGLFRRTFAAGAASPVLPPMLDRVDRIRQLSLSEAAQGKAVDVSGIVTWSLPDADFFFLQDVSGGVRVRLPQGTRPPALQKSLRVAGVTYRGAFTPAVEMRWQQDLGTLAHPAPRRVTYQQAITGNEDGQWVEMRGFLRRTASEGDWRWVYVTTPDGEFVAHLQSAVNFVATPGSLLRVRGVCEVTTDAKNRISGVRLRVPFLHEIVIEQDAPAEVYDLPVRSVADLRLYGGSDEMVRVHVAGVVVHHVPGEYLVLQDGDSGLTVFSREPGKLAPGDRVEVVGILGRDGARTVLREAVFRRTQLGEAPSASVVTDPSVQDFQDDLRLKRVRGTLLDFSRRADRLHMTLQAENSIFDAVLAPGGEVPLANGMELELTGVYRIAFDDFDRPRGFQIELRTPADLVVLQAARFWTVSRALMVAGGLAGAMALVVIWLAALRHRVEKQTVQIRQQIEKQASLEAELERAQRFRSLGLLAGGLAHDFNNLLTGILGNVTLAMLEEKALPLVGESLRDIEASAKRARDLTQQLVTFAKGGDPVRDEVDLLELLQQAGGFALSGAKARAEYRIAAGLWPVHADRNQLGRALQNLLVHARSAMAEGGTIEIRADNEELAAPNGAIAAGRYVRVTIADHGPGVAPERLPGFFDPYAATKFGDDRFSLAISYSIVKRHGGHLEVRTAPEVGTEFRLWIPAAVAGEASAVAASPATVLPQDIAGTRVLLMDDEETIRRLADRLLQRLQCECRTVADGETCVRAYREAMEAGRRFQVVILDLTVPGGMGGQECLRELRKIDPEVRAIVSSGYSTDPVMANFRQYGFRAVVPKPYAVGVMADAIRRVLGAPA